MKIKDRQGTFIDKVGSFIEVILCTIFKAIHRSYLHIFQGSYSLYGLYLLHINRGGFFAQILRSLGTKIEDCVGTVFKVQFGIEIEEAVWH